MKSRDDWNGFFQLFNSLWEQELDELYSNYTTYHNQKIMSFLEVLEGLNAVLAKAYSASRLPAAF